MEVTGLDLFNKYFKLKEKISRPFYKLIDKFIYFFLIWVFTYLPYELLLKQISDSNIFILTSFLQTFFLVQYIKRFRKDLHKHPKYVKSLWRVFNNLYNYLTDKNFDSTIIRWHVWFFIIVLVPIGLHLFL